MGLREAINNKKGVALALAIGLVVCSIAVLIWANSSGLPGNLKKVYFSDDDGKTFFADDITKVPPFDHNGKQAVAAFVYRKGSEPPFVGYLARYRPEVHEKVTGVLGDDSIKAQGTLAEIIREGGMEVKKPGAPQWTKMNMPGADKITLLPAGEGVMAVYP